jgi:ABC-type glycerol-3-phosphate transport system substrate-binding protein
MRQVAVVFVLAVTVIAAAGCGGGGKEEESEPANPQAKAACEGSPLSAKPKLPPSFPMVENTTLTKQTTQGPTEVVEGYWEGDLEEAHDEYVKEFEAAGYQVLFEELEEHDSEVSWKGEGRTGQVALRDDCGGDKIYVHITNRPA